MNDDIVNFLDKMKSLRNEFKKNGINFRIVEFDVYSLSHNLNKKIEDLQLTIRLANCLKSENINTIADLLRVGKDEINSIPDLGKKSFKEIEDSLSVLGIKFGTEVLENNEEYPFSIRYTFNK